MHVSETRTATVWLGPDGLVHLRPLAQREPEVADAKENVAAVVKVSGGVRRPLLVHFDPAAPQSSEWPYYYLSEEARRSVSAMGVVTNSTFSLIFGNLMLGLSATKAPIRMFEDGDAAARWLEEYRAVDSASANVATD